MNDRRGELGMTWDEVAEIAGVTASTLFRNASNPNGPRTTTRKGIERALRWESGSVDAILAGGNPTNMPDNTPAASGTVADPDPEMLDNLRFLRRHLSRDVGEDATEQFLQVQFKLWRSRMDRNVFWSTWNTFINEADDHEPPIQETDGTGNETVRDIAEPNG